ncbi:MAG: hypothetical protein CVU39_22035 [Chloroflexi bacterium HGW-Chloroflexi-10]|nr:MAG: hypothetical protein CVU39_22035 [Chloroflexi bacterium HGW-Chloroflexi-10]
MIKKHPRLKREEKTLRLMIELYCRELHKPSNSLCVECQALQDYALLRLEKCPYQEQKTTCAHCPTHCYQREMREAVRQMMRYAGPRMLLHYPVLAVLHLADGLRKPVDLKTLKNKKATGRKHQD